MIMKQVTLHDKAVRLVEGGVVECAGHFVRFERCPEDHIGCEVCEMDCICRMEMTDLCAECCSLIDSDGYLRLTCNG